MKQIFSLFTILTFFIIGGLHNSMVVFAASNDMQMGINDDNGNKKCVDLCRLELLVDHGVYSVNINFQKKGFKIINKSFFSDKYIRYIYSISNKNLTKKTSPPYLNTDILNYSYHTLIKIVKSNT